MIAFYLSLTAVAFIAYVVVAIHAYWSRGDNQIVSDLTRVTQVAFIVGRKVFAGRNLTPDVRICAYTVGFSILFAAMLLLAGIGVLLTTPVYRDEWLFKLLLVVAFWAVTPCFVLIPYKVNHWITGP